MAVSTVLFPLTQEVTNAANTAALTAVDATAFAPGYPYVIPGTGLYSYSPESTASPSGSTIVAATPKGNWILNTQPHLIMTAANIIDSSQIP